MCACEIHLSFRDRRLQQQFPVQQRRSDSKEYKKRRNHNSKVLDLSNDFFQRGRIAKPPSQWLGDPSSKQSLVLSRLAGKSTSFWSTSFLLVVLPFCLTGFTLILTSPPPPPLSPSQFLFPIPLPSKIFQKSICLALNFDNRFYIYSFHLFIFKIKQIDSRPFL